jgi:hypothetical protein
VEKIKGFFTQKAGPLPVWAWAGIILAGVLGYMYWKKIGPFAGAGSTGTGSSTTPDPTSSLYNPISGNGTGGFPGANPAIPASSGLDGTVSAADYTLQAPSQAPVNAPANGITPGGIPGGGSGGPHWFPQSGSYGGSASPVIH